MILGPYNVWLTEWDKYPLQFLRSFYTIIIHYYACSSEKLMKYTEIKSNRVIRIMINETKIAGDD